MKLKYLIISLIALVAVTACKKELPVTQTEDVWEIVLSSDSEDLVPTKAGNVQKIMSVKKNTSCNVTATLKKNGTDYKNSDLNWEFINTEKDIYSDYGSGNSRTLSAIKKGGTANNLEVQAWVGGVLRGGIDANHGKYVDVKVNADYSIETPGDIYEKGYRDCNGNTNSSYTYGSSAQIKVYEWTSATAKSDVTSSCTNWQTNITGTSISSSGLLSSTSVLGGGVSGTVSCTCNGESLTSSSISVKKRSYNFSVPKTTVNANGETISMNYNVDGFPNATIHSNSASWISFNGGPINMGSGSIDVVFGKNNDYSNRTGTLYLSPGDISSSTNYLYAQSFTQSAQGGSEIELSTYELRFFKEANSETVSVSGVASGQPWSVSSNQSWCTLSKSSSTGPGNITISVSANNSGSTRTANVTFTSMGTSVTLTVTQTATRGEPISMDVSVTYNTGSNPSSSTVNVEIILKNEGSSTITISNPNFDFKYYNLSDTLADGSAALNNNPKLKTTTFTAGETQSGSRSYQGIGGGQVTYTYTCNGKNYSITKTW